jgi:hypothetical protein
MEAPLATAQNTAQTAIQSIGKQMSEVKMPEISAQSISNGATQWLASITSSIDATKASLNNTIGEFSSQNAVGASQEFLNSNSIIAKFAFLIFVVIAFMFLVNLGISLISYFTQPSKTPYLISGMVSGNSNINIPQNPQNPDSIMVYRSNNQSKGLEATWSVWLLINDLNSTKPGTADGKPSFSHIFNKGNTTFTTSGDSTDPERKKIGVANTNNGPGLYIADGSVNTLRLFMDTVKDNNNYLDLTGVPLKKWFHLAIRIQNNIMDVYMNGIISGRQIFSDTPKQNYDDVHVCYNGGFQGQLSNLVYYDHSLGVFEINNIILKGPNLTQSSSVTSNLGYYTYLSNSWYSSKLQ